MQSKLYQPFQKMRFDHGHCFLSGEKLDSEQRLNVFAPWITEAYQLNQRPFEMLDESMLTYADITVPASDETIAAIEKLEEKISYAFSAGYEEVAKLQEQDLFLWISKTVYGIIFKEIQAAIIQQSRGGESFNLSQGLAHRFTMLHNMLQMLIKPIYLDGFKPWSIFICPVDNAENEFSYRDEINTLTFSLRMKDFGIIACLQDNGANRIYNEETWELVKGKKLHPIQFEELCGKIYYSAYLFNRLPDYHIMNAREDIYIEAMPLRGMSAKPLFDDWQNKTYGQVLENFWKKWGFLLLEIIKNPEKPISFLFEEDGSFKEPSSITLEK